MLLWYLQVECSFREDMSRVKHSFDDGLLVLSSDLPDIVCLNGFLLSMVVQYEIHDFVPHVFV